MLFSIVMLILKNKIKPVNLLFIAVILILSPLGELSAAGITIIKNSDRTELLVSPVDNSYHGIELELSGDGTLILENDTDKDLLRFSTGDKTEKIYLYKSLTGFIPEKITIEGNSGWDILAAGIINRLPDTDIEKADIGHIIFSEFTKNSSSWNVYSWNLDPEVLIYDTGDYSVQAKLFKRLAFFVEKPGYVGRLVPDNELQGRHGWNAHDYKAEDLAEFFSKAVETDFQLNTEELSLKQTLLAHGIIKENSTGEHYIAGKGAVLSVSRETEVSWRYRFLTHECLHGLFFTDDAFREDIYSVFEQLQPEEVEFWKHLLDYRSYDVKNHYLVVNEFMAYSLQQPEREIDEYFKGFLYKRMIAARPWEESFVAEFDRNFPVSFKTSVLNLEKVLYNHTGRTAGHLANVYPAEVKDSFFDLFPEI